jgi:RimJ/RimL family protein N-acetyltransferase
MLVELAQAASPAMFPNGENYFKSDWLSEPSPVRQRHSMQWWWRQRAGFSPEDWHLDLAVVVDGNPVGSQGVGAHGFVLRRSVSTGSWLSAAFQGRGLGKEMRAAVLHLAFVGLGAQEALSSAFEGNDRSIGVSRAVGYEDNGSKLDLRAGGRVGLTHEFRMTREAHESHRRGDIVIENLEPCLELFGLGPDLDPLSPPAAQTAESPPAAQTAESPQAAQTAESPPAAQTAESPPAAPTGDD